MSGVVRDCPVLRPTLVSSKIGMPRMEARRLPFVRRKTATCNLVNSLNNQSNTIRFSDKGELARPTDLKSAALLVGEPCWMLLITLREACGHKKARKARKPNFCHVPPLGCFFSP